MFFRSKKILLVLNQNPTWKIQPILLNYKGGSEEGCSREVRKPTQLVMQFKIL